MMLEARNRLIKGKQLKIFTMKQVLQKLLVALAQVKVGTTSENLLCKICQLTFLLSK